MRRTLMFLAAALISLPLWAMHCPQDMAKIDELLQSDPPSDPAVLAKVKELRAEGETLHKAGNHTESVRVLGEALDLLSASE
ncbi:hypothetical protein OEG79_15590 [Pseudomonas sp. Z8(2022)]|jgi:hypothetical protein|uniref:hypothetical protein n=1 Tax=Pseudomonadaceae TaxID=135621 RepID=UPI0021F3E189|nr:MULTISPECIES: hypothetical protein [Pseudomonas]UYP29469.1 hypothetical protein OEG79_15590 [Pseudomonas sp. Z8(2022)]